MNSVFLVLLMIFCHVLADYNLQGWLASAKQKSYWEENAPEEMYKHDYLCALLIHSFSWAFMIMLPIAIAFNFVVDLGFVNVLIYNTIMHALTDHAKANVRSINLWYDQFVHMWQIILTAIWYFERIRV